MQNNMLVNCKTMKRSKWQKSTIKCQN